MRAGSLMPPAMREVSSTLILRALTVAMSLRNSPFGLSAVTVAACSIVTDPCMSTFSTNSLPDTTRRLGINCSSYPTTRMRRSIRPVGT